MKQLFALAIALTTQLHAQTPELLVQLHPQQALRLEFPQWKTRCISSQWNIYVLSPEHDLVKADKLKQWLHNQPQVRHVQQNHPVEYRTAPSDPYYQNAQLWNIDKIGLPDAWQHTTGGNTATGDTIVVAIIDSGCDWQHPDLQRNIWTNAREIPNNHIDDDSNGYTDDYRGWVVYRQNDSLDAAWHGTGVNGIVGAMGDNGIGTVGINWNIRLMQISANPASSGITEANVLEAYDYAATMRRRYNQTAGQEGAFVVATNASFGIDFAKASDHPIWCSVYDSLGQLGIINIASTTNRDNDVDDKGDMPTTCISEFLITTTATTRTDRRSGGYGKRSIDLAAPSSVFTTQPNNTYTTLGGTSAAAPHVTGAAALLYAYPNARWAAQHRDQPSQSARMVKHVLLQTVQQLEELNAQTVSKGRLHVGRAMNYLHEFYSTPERNDLLTVYPNPTKNELNIRWATQQAGEIPCTIYNNMGQIVWSQTINVAFAQTNFTTISCEKWASGLYFVQICVGSEKFSTKFIKY